MSPLLSGYWVLLNRPRPSWRAASVTTGVLVDLRCLAAVLRGVDTANGHAWPRAPERITKSVSERLDLNANVMGESGPRQAAISIFPSDGRQGAIMSGFEIPYGLCATVRGMFKAALLGSGLHCIA
ncbi:MAG: hypothetical protein GYB54_02600 [Gammaproteobacteria bacterium]|nr:hypothetical protein [Gammaproteobacteria bacterium]